MVGNHWVGVNHIKLTCPHEGTYFTIIIVFLKDNNCFIFVGFSYYKIVILNLYFNHLHYVTVKLHWLSVFYILIQEYLLCFWLLKMANSVWIQTQ